MKNIFIKFFSFLIIISSVNFAQSGTAITLKVSTIGIEGGIAKKLNDKINLRGNISYFSYNTSGDTGGEDPILYDVDLNFFSVSAGLDFYPLTDWFKLSAGLVFNNSKVEGTGTAGKSYTLGLNTYTPAQIGSLSIKAEPKLSISPYIGIGFGNQVTEGKHFGIFFDIGLFYQGSPDVTLSADENSMIYPTTSQESIIEDDIANLKWFPYVGFGLSYQF